MKAIYSSINELDILFPVAKKLRDEHGITPIYWSGANNMSTTIKSAFPDILFHDFMDAIKGEWPAEIDLEIGYRQFGRDLIAQYMGVEKIFYELCLTRSDPGNGFKYHELTNYFHRALAAALSFISTHKPDIWISSLPPHAMYDNVMYEVCRQNGIKTIILYDTNLPGYMLTINDLNYSIDPLRTEAARLLAENIDTSESALPEAVRKYVQGIRKDYEHGKPFQFEINYPGDSGLDRHSFKRIRSELSAKQSAQIRTLIKHTFRHGFSKTPFDKPHYIKQANVSWKDSFRDAKSWHKYRIRITNDAQRAFNSYQSLCNPYDPQKPYVFFPLHMQPECTTVPQGGEFADQLMTLRMLRSALDSNQYIFVKEAPGQFRWHRGSSARYTWIYEEMASMHNVHLLPMDTNPFTLIDNSECVFCITGTAGWESIVRGKPVIAMGSLYYYKGFDGVYQAETTEDIRNTLLDIKLNPEISWETTLRNIHALINISHPCTHQTKHLKLHQIPPNENTNILTQAIVSSLSISLE